MEKHQNKIIINIKSKTFEKMVAGLAVQAINQSILKNKRLRQIIKKYA